MAKIDTTVANLIAMIKDVEICVVRVSASAAPVHLDEGGESRLYVRLGNTSRELSGKDIVEYVQSRWGTSR